MEYHIPLSRLREIYRFAKAQDAMWGHIDGESWYRDLAIEREKLAIAEQRIAALEAENAELREQLAEQWQPVSPDPVPDYVDVTLCRRMPTEVQP